MAKNSYVNANVVPTYDSYASWLDKTNRIIYDMSTSVVTVNSSATPDTTTGNVFISGYFGANVIYTTTSIQGGTANTVANLAITSGLTISGQTWTSANLNVTGSVNASININSSGIVSGNGTFNNNLTVSNTATINVAKITTANITNSTTTGTANIATANITSLGVTGTSVFNTIDIGTGSTKVSGNSTTITVGNSTVFTSINATSFSGTSNNSINFGGVSLSTIQSQITGNAATAYSNAVTYSDSKAATAYANAVAVAATDASNKAATAYANAVANAAAIYQTKSGLAANVLTLTANASGFLGNSSGTIGNITNWITSNAATAYANAVTYSDSKAATAYANAVSVASTDASNKAATAYANAVSFANYSISNGSWVSANANYANNSGGVAGIAVNNVAASDGYVLAYDSASSKIVFKNPTGLSAALNSNTIIINDQLQAGSNGTSYVANIFSNSTVSIATLRANTISLTVDGGSITLNSSAIVTSTFYVGNTTSNVSVTTGTVTLRSNTTSTATINSTTFSGTSNNSNFLNGTTLSTIQNQITGNASTAYANAVANAAAIYQTTAGLSANVLTLTANASGFLGNSSGTIGNIANWITSNAASASATAYANAVANAAAIYQTTAGLSANVLTLTANDTNNLGGVGASAYINTSGSYTVSGVHTYNANISISGNTSAVLIVGNTTSDVVVNSTSMNIGNSTVYTIVNSTVFSGTSNNAAYLSGTTLSTIQSQITGNAATAYSNSIAVASTDASNKAATAYSNATTFSANASNLGNGTVPNARLNTANTTSSGIVQLVDSTTNTSIVHAATPNSVKTAFDSAAAAYSNATVFASNASNINTGTLNISRIPSGVVNTTGAFTITGVHTYNSNVVITGNTTALLTIGTTTSGIDANSTVISIGNTTVYSTINSTAFSRQANGATYLGNEGSGLTVTTIQSQITGNAATAYSNAVSVASTDASNKAATAYSNAVTYSDSKAATAYANAVTYSDSKAATAYANATSFAANASNITTGTLSDNQLNGIYSGIGVNTGNYSYTLFSGTGSSGSTHREVLNLVAYKSSSGSATGAIVFTAPDTSSTIMHRFEISGLLHANGNTIKTIVQGYKSSSAADWSNTSKINLGIADVQIRFGVNPEGKNCIILGDTTTVWSYPHIAIAHAMFSYTGTNSAYCYGWTRSLVTDLSTYTQITPTITNSDINGTANNSNYLGGVAASSYINTSGSFTITGVHTHNANVVLTGNTTSTLRIGTTATANIVANTTSMTFSNSNITGFLGDISTITATSYTFSNNDSGSIIEFANSSAISVTLPNTAPKGFNVMAVQAGVGNVTFVPATGSTLVKRSTGANTGGTWAAATLYVRSNSGGAAVWVLAGDTV